MASIADITDAKVTEEEKTSSSSMRRCRSLPGRLKTSALEFRWDISDISGEGAAWTLTVTLDERAEASVFSAEGYGAGTADDTFLSDMLIDREEIKVRLNTAEIGAFPMKFEPGDLPPSLDRFPDDPEPSSGP